MQVLENNRNQLETKGVQLASSKEQLYKYSLQMENRDQEISSLKDRIKTLEKQLMSNVKTQLLEAEETFKEKPKVNGVSSKVSMLLIISVGVATSP